MHKCEQRVKEREKERERAGRGIFYTKECDDSRYLEGGTS